eukprot:snap_masked-scaffold_8-processed-gene-5.34-mRNA-1 protein AED:0.00 eAED:0.00 QI:0/-1/0/1/-1/1/1/0/391
MLWLDKYTPKSFEKLDYHNHLTGKLRNLTESRNPPHLLFYGPSGSGKMTRVKTVLRALYGSGATRLKQEARSLKTPTNKTIEFTTISSSYHIEINPTDVGNQDTFMVQHVIKEIAQYSPLHTLGKKVEKEQTQGKINFGGFVPTSGPVETPQKKSTSKAGFKVVVISDAGKLSPNAQHALRRTMEKYVKVCRLILICNSVEYNRLIPALRSRCLGIRVPAPTEEDVIRVLQKVSSNENLCLSNEEKLFVGIARESKRDLRRALLMLQTYSAIGKGDGNVPQLDWEIYIQDMAKRVCQSQSPQNLLNLRNGIYELLANCIPGNVIITRLCEEIVQRIQFRGFIGLKLKTEITKSASFYEKRMGQGTKDVFHIEAFLARFMLVYKKELINQFA